ncbi:hypothetical protein H0H81_005832 [Sphagnurus paluster]|uniref:C2H2-type domain-containing protein n=1 Tax=Sphagnurus paluster TaxID=117069 RepID=A0A9P7KH39_9AGAR|nr:hypothetical protein H0H81_005832 [Sphagnurus paluster]
MMIHTDIWSFLQFPEEQDDSEHETIRAHQQWLYQHVAFDPRQTIEPPSPFSSSSSENVYPILELSIHPATPPASPLSCATLEPENENETSVLPQRIGTHAREGSHSENGSPSLPREQPQEGAHHSVPEALIFHPYLSPGGMPSQLLPVPHPPYGNSSLGQSNVCPMSVTNVRVKRQQEGMHPPSDWPLDNTPGSSLQDRRNKRSRQLKTSASTPLHVEGESASDALESPGGPFRQKIGTSRIINASVKRRKRPALFHCSYPGCSGSFTTELRLKGKLLVNIYCDYDLIPGKILGHLNSHSGRKFPCDLCGQQLCHQQDVERHKESIHICPDTTCGEVFNTKERTRAHFQKQHANKDYAETLAEKKASKSRKTAKTYAGRW